MLSTSIDSNSQSDIVADCSNSQSALWPKSGRSEHKLVRVCIRPNFSGSRYRECMRTAKIGLLQITCLTNFTHFLYMYALGPGPYHCSLLGIIL